MNYTVYMHTCPNGKRYVGITKNITRRWRSKGVEYSHAIASAINKYGWDNIEHKIMANWLSQEEAEILERYLVEIFQTNNRKYGYNLTNGGEKQKHYSSEVLEKMRRSQVGKKLSSECKLKISKKLKERVFTQEHLKNIREFNKSKIGIPRTETTRKKIKQCLSKGVIQCNLDGTYIGKFKSAKEAMEMLNLKSYTSIGKCCRGGQKQAYGYIWKYAEEQS